VIYLYDETVTTEKPFTPVIPYTNQQQQDHLTVRVSEGPSRGSWGPLKPSSVVIARSEAPVSGSEARSPIRDGRCVASDRDTAQQIFDYNQSYSPIIPKGSVSGNEFKLRDKVTPGFSESFPKCGTVSSKSIRAKIVCPENIEHFEKTLFDSCHRPGCPVCWPGWAGRAADRAADVVEGFRKAHDYWFMPQHIDISPPPEIVPFDHPSPEALAWLLDEVNRKLDVLGVVAAAVVPHPYRIRPERLRLVNDMASRADQNRYEWALSQPDWYDYVYFSPHAHLIVYGKLIHVYAFEKLTNWQYHNHSVKRPIHSRDDVVAILRYLLSHAWVRNNNKAVRYLRGMSSTKLLVTEKKFEEPVLCPVCHAHAVRIPYLGEDCTGKMIMVCQDLHYADPAYHIRVVRTFEPGVSLASLKLSQGEKAKILRRKYFSVHGAGFY
jgi:hypothetical protein